jgi:hypothetical protein
MNKMSVAGLALLALVATGCDKSSGASSGGTASTTNSSAIEVPAQGKKFDPPVKADPLPAGAWYCDMGTVHYARMEKGDGTCPVCKMDLKQKK